MGCSEAPSALFGRRGPPPPPCLRPRRNRDRREVLRAHGPDGGSRGCSQVGHDSPGKVFVAQLPNEPLLPQPRDRRRPVRAGATVQEPICRYHLQRATPIISRRTSRFCRVRRKHSKPEWRNW
jgi:hypothetical protein